MGKLERLFIVTNNLQDSQSNTQMYSSVQDKTTSKRDPHHYQEYDYQPGYNRRNANKNASRATSSLVLGIIGMIAWLLPIAGLPITIVGLVHGIHGQKSSQKGKATAGLVLSIIGLVLTVINAALGALLAVLRVQ